MYIPTPAEQTHVFLMCIGFGFVLGIFYDLVRLIRKTFFPLKKALIIQDILYCVISTFAVFCFLLCINNGEARFFTFLGLAFGWVIYYFTFGVLVVRVADTLAGAVHRLFKPIKSIFRLFYVNIKTRVKKSEEKAKKSSKKLQNKSNTT